MGKFGLGTRTYPTDDRLDLLPLISNARDTIQVVNGHAAVGSSRIHESVERSKPACRREVLIAIRASSVCSI